MKTRTIILRSLVYYWRSHVGVVLGSAIGTAVIVGALLAGDSVRYSLRRIASLRLGRTELVLVSQERLFRSELADEIEGELDTDAAPGLLLRGVATVPDGTARANNVQVVGIDERFWALGPERDTVMPVASDRAVVNERLASALGLEVGDPLVIRIAGTDRLPREFVISPEKIGVRAMRLIVSGIATAEQFGMFGLRPSQVSPATIFVSLPMISGKLEIDGRANMILLASREEGAVSAEEADAALSRVWGLADASLELRDLKDRGIAELRSERIFLGPEVADAALQASEGARPIVTYFVNGIASGDKETPYSFVSAPGSPLVPADMRDDEIILNRWTAKDLRVRTGDTVSLRYYVLGAMRKLQEQTSKFRVRSIVRIRDAAADRELMPLLPGLADADSCSEWDPGIAIDLDKIRDKDEEYWDDYRGTPKAFVTLSAAAAMWTNRIGFLTAVRYPASSDISDRVQDGIMSRIEPSSLGLAFRATRLEGLAAVDGSVDFGGLFLGLSFFLVVASLLLTGMLFGFGVANRAGEAGTLLALGWPVSSVRRLYLLEGLGLALVGGLVGVAGGVAYNRVVMHGLGSFWRGAVGTSSLHPRLLWTSLSGGVLAGIVTAGVSMWLTIRKRAFRFLRELRLAARAASAVASRRKLRISMVLFVVLAGAGLLVMAMADSGGGKEVAGIFFGAGVLLLCGLMAAVNAILLSGSGSSAGGRLTIASMILKSPARRRGRSLAVVGMLACGIFMVVAVGANRHDSVTDTESRASGTGGFAFIGETALPILYDLNTGEGQARFGLEGVATAGVSFVQLRVMGGDDASCLNLNRTTSPTMLGINPEKLSSRGAFSFAKLLDGVDEADPWAALSDVDGDVVPAIADMSVIMWGLGKSLGDTLDYVDEKGRPFKLKLVAGLANSVFQGSVLISDEVFMERFPSASGTRMFLADVPVGERDTFAVAAGDGLKDLGLALERPSERLAVFATVEDTYLVIFLGLGGLGLVLGTVGMGVVVMRNVLERRNELAALRAVGFSGRALRRMLIAEHLLLLVAGLIVGGSAGVAAVLPAFSASGTTAAVGPVAFLLAGILASGVVWTSLAAAVSMRGDLIASLREE